MADKLYTTDDIVVSCNACGAYSLTRNPSQIKHYPTCGGLLEVKKWEDYYSTVEIEEEK